MNHISDKDLVSRIYKGLYNSTIRRETAQSLKRQKAYIDISLKKECTCPGSIMVL